MGYTTYFGGAVAIDPPLNAAEADYLRRFAGSRRMRTSAGPYFADPGEDFGQFGHGERIERAGRSIEVLDYNRPPEGQPGLWCQWVPDEAGESLVWDGGEKFYEAPAWMKYLIQHFLMPGAVTQRVRDSVPGTGGYADWDAFTYNHRLDGIISAQGEEPDDRWLLVVKDNVVMEAPSNPVSYGEPEPV